MIHYRNQFDQYIQDLNDFSNLDHHHHRDERLHQLEEKEMIHLYFQTVNLYTVLMDDYSNKISGCFTVLRFEISCCWWGSSG